MIRANISGNILALSFATLLAVLIMTGPVAASTHGPNLFGTVEIPKTDIGAFKRWTGMLSRVKEGKTLRAAIPDWETLIDSLKNKSPFELIKVVNSFVNTIPYQTDPIVWRREDYWATPEEFYQKTGDCEDFAITKYLILKDRGVDHKNMRIAVVKDLNLNQYHAVLALYTNDGYILILDNQAGEVILSTRIRHYKVVYSINETGWWRHL